MKDLTFDCVYGRFNVRVAVLIEHNEKLLIQNHKSQYWLIGGRIHFGEDSRQAIIREIAEELCYTISDGDRLELNFVCENFFKIHSTPYHEMLIIYRLVLNDGAELIAKNNFKCNDNDYFNERWVDFADLPKTSLVPRFIPKLIYNRELRHIIFHNGKMAE